MDKINYNKLLKQKKIKPITCLTAYTKAIAKILDGKVDLILIGDSLATALYDMRNTQNVSIETISQMLGHKSIKSTQIYAKVVDSKISDEMDMFNQTIPNNIKLSKVV